MAEQLNPGTTAVLEHVQPLAPLQPEVVRSTPEREARLRTLLGMEYDYARESGLVDYFDYNPTTGEDGLVHTLAGDTDVLGIPGGFHHEESGKQLGGVVTDEAGNERYATRVDREHLETAKSSTRRWYRHRPGEPYIARIAINDRTKLSVHKTPEGKSTLEPAKNAMFPKEYDALAVLQAVRQAYHTSDIPNARHAIDDRGRPALVTEGQAVLIDGKTTMPIRLVLNPDTYRVRTAIPIISGKHGLMDLTDEQMMAHATYRTPTSSLRS
jgi:EndoU nuclease-like protein